MRVSQNHLLSPNLALRLLLGISPASRKRLKFTQQLRTQREKSGQNFRGNLTNSRGSGLEDPVPEFFRSFGGARAITNGEQGLTLIECLVAIVIVTLTILAITPPIMLATGTRIQSRRAEQANQIAQGEIDRIRFLVERGGYTLNELPDSTGNRNPLTNVPVATVPPTGTPSASSPLQSPARTCPGVADTARYPFRTPTLMPRTNLVQVDVNGDCIPEYVMQVFRNDGPPLPGNPPPPPLTFDVGVRVYPYFPGQPFPPLLQERASLIAGTSTRDRQAGNAQKPLAVLFSTMARNDQSRSLGQICNQQAARNGAGNCSY